MKARDRSFYRRAVVAAALLLGIAVVCRASPAQTGKPASGIVALRVLPTMLALDNVRDVRKLLVSGLTPDGFWVDLTAQASFMPAAKLVSRDADGFFHPVKPGKTSLIVRAAGRQAAVPVWVRSVVSPPI